MDPTETPIEQGPAPSMTDRISNIFGAQEEPTPDLPKEPAASELPDGEPIESAPVEETFELELDGEKFTLPKKLEKGFLQEKDYTQKSQTLAEQKRNAELVLEQARIGRLNEEFAQETRQDQDQLRAFEWALQQPVDWNSLTTDEAFRKKLQLDEWKDGKERLEKALGVKRQEFGQKVQTEFHKLRQQSIEAIAKRIPGWTDTTAKQIREHAIQEGYTETELNSIFDPRHVSTLWKAQQYDLLKAKAAPAVASAKGVKTTSTNPMPQHVKDKLAFRKEVGKHAPGSSAQQTLVKDRIAKLFG